MLEFSCVSRLLKHCILVCIVQNLRLLSAIWDSSTVSPSSSYVSYFNFLRKGGWVLKTERQKSNNIFNLQRNAGLVTFFNFSGGDDGLLEILRWEHLPRSLRPRSFEEEGQLFVSQIGVQSSPFWSLVEELNKEIPGRCLLKGILVIQPPIPNLDVIIRLVLFYAAPRSLSIYPKPLWCRVS